MSQTGLMNSRRSQLEASAEEEWSKKKNGILSDDDASWASVCCVCLSSSLSLSLSLATVHAICGGTLGAQTSPAGCRLAMAGNPVVTTPTPARSHASPIVLFSRAFVVVLLCFPVTGVVVSSKYLLHDQ